MHVRRAAPAERHVLRGVHLHAFGPDSSAVDVFDRLLDHGDEIAELSLVAFEGAQVVGHVLGSEAFVDERRVAALGPIGVLPTFQRQGIGSALVDAFASAADELGLPLIALLGSPAYYSRLGFVRGTDLGVLSPPDVPAAAFQVRLLAAYDSAVRGQFRYAPAFAID